MPETSKLVTGNHAKSLWYTSKIHKKNKIKEKKRNKKKKK